MEYTFDIFRCFFCLSDEAPANIESNTLNLSVTTDSWLLVPDHETKERLINSGYEQAKELLENKRTRVSKIDGVISTAITNPDDIDPNEITEDDVRYLLANPCYVREKWNLSDKDLLRITRDLLNILLDK